MKKLQKITTTKTTVECYKVRGSRGLWADLTIDMNGKSGRIQIASDYGSWQNYWGSCGEQFKDFLIGLNIEYASGKFGADKWFDLEKTISSMARTITEYADSKEQKAELFNELRQLKDCSGKEEFISVVQNCDKIMELNNHCPDICHSINPMFQRFWDECWPHFLNVLREEIAVEKLENILKD